MKFMTALDKITSERRASAELWRDGWSDDQRSDDFHRPLGVDERGRLREVDRRGNYVAFPCLTVRDLTETDWRVRACK